MIVDIKQINGEYYDFGNGFANRAESFLTTAKELKDLGIKNYYFMLKIINPRAAEIDPYKPNISKQEILTIMYECRVNMWFYMRNVARLRTDAGIVPYGLHRGLAAAAWCFSKNQDACLTEPRQTWKTTGMIAGPLTWAFQLSQNLRMRFFGKDEENTQKNLTSMKGDIELLPPWLQFKRYMSEEDGSKGKVQNSKWLTKTLHNGKMHNTLIIAAKPSNRSHANNLARGDSGAIMYFDEIEHTPYFDVLFANSAPAFKTAAENARSVGLPACRVFSSTPGDPDTPEGKCSYPIIKSMVPWTEKVYDMTEEEIAEYKSAYQKTYSEDKERDLNREVVDIFYIEYQYYQVRRNFEWVMEQYRLSGDKTAIQREVLMRRLRGANGSPFTQEHIQFLIENMRKATTDLLILKKWRFLIYEHGVLNKVNNQIVELDPSIPYIVGIDCSSGTGGDNTAITIVNPRNLKTAAEFKNPYISTTDLVRLLIVLVMQHIPRAIIYPERNSMGIAVIQMLLETSIKDNLYWSDNVREVEQLTEESLEEYQLRVAANQWKKYGVYTSPKTRSLMFGYLMRHMNEFPDLLLTEYLVDDMCHLVRSSTGKIAAGSGFTDDNVMSYNIAIYLFYTADNLGTFGVDNTVHPIVGVVEDGMNLPKNESDTGPVIYDDENRPSWEQYMIEDSIRVEEETQELVNMFGFVESEGYSKHDDEFDDETGEYEISSYLFDHINHKL